MPASYGGQLVFGAAVKIQHVPNANAGQINTFFGVKGTQAIDGGGRGRTFMIEGVFLGVDPSALRVAEKNLLDLADGKPRVLVDTFGASWSHVVYRGDYQPGRLHFHAAGVALPYRAVFHGLL